MSKGSKFNKDRNRQLVERGIMTAHARKIGKLYTEAEVNQIIARDKAMIAALRDTAYLTMRKAADLDAAQKRLELELAQIDALSLLIRYNKQAARDILRGQDDSLLTIANNWRRVYEAVTPDPDSDFIDAVIALCTRRIDGIRKLVSDGYDSDGGEELVSVISEGEFSSERIRQLWQMADEKEKRGRKDEQDCLMEIAFSLAEIRRTRSNGKRGASAKAEIYALKTHYEILERQGGIVGRQKAALDKLRALTMTGSAPATWRKALEDAFPEILSGK